jgi:hypothetical protein
MEETDIAEMLRVSSLRGRGCKCGWAIAECCEDCGWQYECPVHDSHGLDCIYEVEYWDMIRKP